MERFIWSIDQTRKIRIKDVREWSIDFDQYTDKFYVMAHGYGFGRGVPVLHSKDKDECHRFIDTITTPVLRKDGGPGDDLKEDAGDLKTE